MASSAKHRRQSAARRSWFAGARVDHTPNHVVDYASRVAAASLRLARHRLETPRSHTAGPALPWLEGDGAEPVRAGGIDEGGGR